ncbi:AGAP002018-PA [Anopheles gambiae str. PEST]|uniref:protein-histidine N-methyltransferase n=1 Tax=Anopheles gambiae TaxID=7165 RepID=Q7PYM7_ANOGA|nr:AGAP002018-PA [Anopheles gambiae str. PEST]
MNGGAPTKALSKGKVKELNGLVEELMQHGFREANGADELLAQHRDMAGVLDRIRRVEPKLRTTNGRPRMETVAHFMRWAVERGCQVENVRVAEHAEYGGLGLESCGPIPAGECIITVPRSMFFYVTNEPRYRQLLELMPGAMMSEQGNIMLALALIMERFRAKSDWKPYLDLLPDRYTTPLYYTTEDMGELAETDAFLPALKLCKHIARQYGFIRRFVQEKVDELRDCFTYDVFRWAVSTVMTRQNKVPVNLAEFDGMDHTLALIPLWDMANHAFPDTANETRCVAETCYNATNEQLECSLTREVSDIASVPIFIVYGTRTDAEFLVHNGFVCPRNPHANVQKRFTLVPAIPLYKERAHLLELLGMPTTGTFSFGPAREPAAATTTTPISQELISLARVSSMTAKELDEYTAMKETQRQTLRTYQALLPAELCARTERWLATVMKIMLLRYPTTIEQDEALLKTNRHHIRRLLIEYRLGEKQILRSWCSLRGV